MVPSPDCSSPREVAAVTRRGFLALFCESPCTCPLAWLPSIRGLDDWVVLMNSSALVGAGITIDFRVRHHGGGHSRERGWGPWLGVGGGLTGKEAWAESWGACKCRSCSSPGDGCCRQRERQEQRPCGESCRVCPLAVRAVSDPKRPGCRRGPRSHGLMGSPGAFHVCPEHNRGALEGVGREVTWVCFHLCR
jgi:hypothetical protein